MSSRTTSEFKEIPRRVLIADPSDITCSYSSTPGGTLFSTTPGGTKIVYERSFLLNMRNSPLSRTPPSWEIPDALQKGSPKNKIMGTSPIERHIKCPKKSNKGQQRVNINNTNNKKTNNNHSIEEIEQFPLEL